MTTPTVLYYHAYPVCPTCGFQGEARYLALDADLSGQTMVCNGCQHPILGEEIASCMVEIEPWMDPRARLAKRPPEGTYYQLEARCADLRRFLKVALVGMVFWFAAWLYALR